MSRSNQFASREKSLHVNMKWRGIFLIKLKFALFLILELWRMVPWYDSDIFLELWCWSLKDVPQYEKSIAFFASHHNTELT